MNRRLILPACLAATALLLTSCSAAETPEGADGVTFAHPSIDGLELSFDTRPASLVMDCYAYSALHEYGLEPDALFGFDCENPFVMGDIDTSGIDFVGKDGEIDVEKLAELRPDAIIGQGTADGWSWFDEDVNAQVTRVADFIPLPKGTSVDESIAFVREVAEFLGADVSSDAITSSDDDLAEAKESFRAAIDGTGLNVMLTSPSKEMLYTGVGFVQADLLEELGATIVGAEPPATGNPWGQIAWEDASSYDADVILIEGYGDDYAFTTDLWDVLPAVKADQLGAWGSKGAMTSSNYAAWLNDLTALVTASDKVS